MNACKISQTLAPPCTALEVLLAHGKGCTNSSSGSLIVVVSPSLVDY